MKGIPKTISRKLLSARKTHHSEGLLDSVVLEVHWPGSFYTKAMTCWNAVCGRSGAFRSLTSASKPWNSEAPPRVPQPGM
jgi:hypothetical protein